MLLLLMLLLLLSGNNHILKASWTLSLYPWTSCCSTVAVHKSTRHFSSSLPAMYRNEASSSVGMLLFSMALVRNWMRGFTQSAGSSEPRRNTRILVEEGCISAGKGSRRPSTEGFNMFLPHISRFLRTKSLGCVQDDLKKPISGAAFIY